MLGTHLPFMGCNDWDQPVPSPACSVPAEAHSSQLWAWTLSKPIGRCGSESQVTPVIHLLVLSMKMLTRVTQSHYSNRVVRHVYQIGPSLMWQKQHVLLVNEPTGVNTTQAAHELQWKSVYFACSRRRFFWHFCS